MNILIVGAGLAGSVFANQLVANNRDTNIKIIDKRNHIGGNCYTEIDKITKVEMHKYGPHIFHTNDDSVWDFITLFTEFNEFRHKVKASAFGKIFSFPINLHTINQFYNTSFSPNEAQEFIKKVSKEDCKRLNIIEPANFEEQAISMIGSSLYHVFFKFYTTKQWGKDPKELPASILKRIPLRFNYDDTYFHNAKYQGIPKDGYTKMFERLLDCSRISIELETEFNKDMIEKFDHVLYTGTIDSFFDYKFGKLDYRTIIFRDEHWDGDCQGIAVMNYTDNDYPWTRIVEHKYFKPEIKLEQTIITKEFPQDDDGSNPFYPVRDEKNIKTYNMYKELADNEKKTIFVGRLANYMYYDMDQVIASSLKKCNDFLKGI